MLTNLCWRKRQDSNAIFVKTHETKSANIANVENSKVIEKLIPIKNIISDDVSQFL